MSGYLSWCATGCGKDIARAIMSWLRQDGQQVDQAGRKVRRRSVPSRYRQSGSRRLPEAWLPADYQGRITPVPRPWHHCSAHCRASGNATPAQHPPADPARWYPLRLQSRTFSTDQACADALSLERSRTAKHTDARDVEYPAPPTFITRVDNPRHALA